MSQDDDIDMVDAISADQSSSTSQQSTSNQNQSSSSSSNSQQQTLAQEYRGKTYTIDILPDLMKEIRSTDFNKQLNAAIGIRKLLSIEKNPPIQAVIDAKLVPVLMDFLRSDSYVMQFECLWALTNIASGTSDHTKAVVDQGAIREFITLIESPNDDVCEQAVWGLGNIAGDSAFYRDMCLNQGALPVLLKLLVKTPKLTILRNGVWTISNLCRGKPSPNFNMIAPVIPILAQLIYHTDSEVLTDSLWALSYISDGENDKIQAVIEAGVVRRVIELLMHTEPQVITPALRTVGNIATGNESQTQTLLNVSGFAEILMNLTQSTKKSIKKESLWTLSNITAGTSKQIEAVFGKTENIEKVIIACLNESFDVAKEACWALSNACSGADKVQMERLVETGIMECLIEVLMKKDPKTVEVALEGLKQIFGAGEVNTSDNINPYVNKAKDTSITEHLTNLLNHSSSLIRERAAKLMEYLEEKLDDEAEIDDAALAQVDSRKNRDNQEAERDN